MTIDSPESTTTVEYGVMAWTQLVWMMDLNGEGAEEPDFDRTPQLFAAGALSRGFSEPRPLSDVARIRAITHNS